MYDGNRQLYLDLIKKVLTDSIYRGSSESDILSSRLPVKLIVKLLKSFNLKLSLIKSFDSKRRAKGTDWPQRAHTMIGMKRLDNLQFCIERLLNEKVPGDLIETGAWRGGACILMRAVLKIYDVRDRIVWIADSFEGLPKPNIEKYPLDKQIPFYTLDSLKVSLAEVKDNFKRYDLLDDQVRFLKGWFGDTLPKAPISKLAIIRVDGDMYESTIDSLKILYPKLSRGGFVIIDDYGDILACRQAVLDFRERNNIREKFIKIDSNGIYWRRD